MKRSILLFSLTSLIYVCGCSSKYRYTTSQEACIKLMKGKGVFISIPENGSYGGTIYPNSGIMTARSLESALMDYTNTIKVSDSCMGNTCFEHIDTDIYAYYFEPKILHWEERATEWSGLSDRITISLRAYNTENKKLICSQQFSGSSK